MNYPRIMIAAPKSGSGKTTITCGLLKALKDRGYNPCSFKCGPDYIDPMFHRNVIGIEAGNLDTFFTEGETTRKIFKAEYVGDIAIIEGVMGLYDGVGGVEKEGSSYDLADTLECPIILVVDAKGAGKSILAEIKGFLDYDEKKLIKGVILNKTSTSFANILKPLIEEELGIKFLGVLESDKDIFLSSRHLGLVLPDEIEDLRQQLEKLAANISKEIHLDEIIDIAKSASDSFTGLAPWLPIGNVNTIRLAVARYSAFCFYYKENLEMLKSLGVELVEFSPLKDKRLPENISGLLLGGGYPENYLQELSQNESMKKSIKEAIKAGLPTLAECGGFMYLMEEIEAQNGESESMVGYFNGKATWQGKLVRFGYVIINSGDFKIKGHEFHYFDTDNNGDDCILCKPTGNRQYYCIHKNGMSHMGFAHLYYPSSPAFINSFVEAMKKYGGK